MTALRHVRRRRPPHRPADGRSPRWLVWLVVVGVAAGLGLRVWVLLTPLGVLDSDEAIVGLMARHMPEELPAFYWGQHYGGIVEPLLVAGAFAVAGPGTLALKAVAVALSAASAALVWRIGRHTVGTRAAALAGVAFWVWPASFVWWSTKERGLYWGTLVAALVVVLAAVRLGVGEDRLWGAQLVGMGLALGLGWWVSPQVVYLAVPALLWLVVRRPRYLYRGLVAVPFAVIGALPWIVANAQNGWLSFDVPPQPGPNDYASHLSGFFEPVLPMALGLRVPWGGGWLPPGAGRLLYWLALGGFVWSIVAAMRDGDDRRDPLALLLAAGAYPFLYAVSPFSWYTSEPRYLLFLAPVAAILLAWGLSALPAQPVVAPVAVLALVALTAVGIARMTTAPDAVPQAGDAPVPDDMTSLVDTLLEEDVDAVFADYWVAYRLTFESAEQVIATPAAGSVRYAPYHERVRADDAPAYVFVAGSRHLRPFLDALSNLSVPARAVDAGGFVVVVPSRSVMPEETPRAWR